MLVQSAEDGIRVKVRLEKYTHAPLWMGLYVVLYFQFHKCLAHKNCLSSFITWRYRNKS